MSFKDHKPLQVASHTVYVLQQTLALAQQWRPEETEFHLVSLFLKSDTSSSPERNC